VSKKPPSQQDSNRVPESVFRLEPGERITDCSALWAASDRVVEELGKCNACEHPTFRVITITSAEKLERRTALCGHHYVAAARTFPELWQSRPNATG
jgi:hypothetical protein